ncbi:MAG: TIGR02221 family CRISPR-associated protein [Pseudomonadales bacterium]|jgi:CRISPR-associated Csx2 family protein|nr:TIGR02221 family CRISPR-associated protein [Pseudomonadales bacterium]
MRRQFSFLGRARQDPRTGYQKVRYAISDGHIIESAFLGLALAAQERPEELWILGTSGSMWDLLLDDPVSSQAVSGEQQYALLESAESQQVSNEVLEPFEKVLSDHLGLSCRLRVIDYARTDVEQAGLLRTLAAPLQPGDEIIIDVTHGFRHLPMLALAAAHYLERVRQVRVTDIVYGALDMRNADGAVPVLRLNGLLRVLDWVQALAAYDASGDYAVFGSLLAKAGTSKEETTRLGEASRLERITNHVVARQKLNGLDLSTAENDPLAALFLPELERRLIWWKKSERWQREATLARENLQRGDYLRAALFAQEAVITRALPERDADQYDNREDARKRLLDENSSARLLFALRNELVHGIKSHKGPVKKMLQSAESLDKGLHDLIRSLLS